MDNGASSYRRFLDGEDDSFVEIIKEYKDGLMLYLNRYVKNIHIAEELMEDTFAKLVVRKPRFSGKSSFKTFLYAIGRNIAVDYLRKTAKLPLVSAEELSLLLRDEADVEREYLREEQKILVHKALNHLNPEYSRVLYLSYFEDFTIKETANILKKSYKQTENLLYRAKLSLRTQLIKEGFVHEKL